MKPQSAHAHEDRLLDFAYGELPPVEARSVAQHVEGCEHCARALAGIRGVRTAMARLPVEPAPEAGLESLLAYAQQASRRAAAGPAPAPRWWRRWLAPAVGLAAVGFFGLVAHRVYEQVDLSPQLSQKAARNEDAKSEEEPAPRAPAVAAAPVPPPAPPAPAPAADKTREDAEYAAATASPAVTQGNRGAGGGAMDALAKKSMREFSGSASDKLDLGKAESKALRRTKGGKVAYAEKPAAMQPASSYPKDFADAAPPAEAVQEEQEAYAPAPKQKLAEAEPRSSLRIGGASTGTVAGVVTPPELESASERARQAPVASAPGRQSSSFDDMKQEASGASLDEVDALSRIASLSRQAQEAQRAGDRATEASLLRSALAAGARGTERLGLLNRLCEAEFASGRRQAAIEVCRQVLQEAPGSGAARMALKRLESESAVPSKKAALPASAAPAD